MTFDSRSVTEGDLFFCVPGLRPRWPRLRGGQALDSGGGGPVRRAHARARRSRGGRVPILAGGNGSHGSRVLRAAVGRSFDARSHGHQRQDDHDVAISNRSWPLRSHRRSHRHHRDSHCRVLRPGVRTTPDSLDLQRSFAEMRTAGVTAVAMEVTSHALILHRIEGVRFAAAAFTNLSQDHLDFHAGMEDYFAAKRSLFIPETNRSRGRQRRRSQRPDHQGFGERRDDRVRHRSGRRRARGVDSKRSVGQGVRCLDPSGS